MFYVEVHFPLISHQWSTLSVTFILVFCILVNCQLFLARSQTPVTFHTRQDKHQYKLGYCTAKTIHQNSEADPEIGLSSPLSVSASTLKETKYNFTLPFGISILASTKNWLIRKGVNYISLLMLENSQYGLCNSGFKVCQRACLSQNMVSVKLKLVPLSHVHIVRCTSDPYSQTQFYTIPARSYNLAKQQLGGYFGLGRKAPSPMSSQVKAKTQPQRQPGSQTSLKMGVISVTSPSSEQQRRKALSRSAS